MTNVVTHLQRSAPQTDTDQTALTSQQTKLALGNEFQIGIIDPITPLLFPACLTGSRTSSLEATDPMSINGRPVQTGSHD